MNTTLERFASGALLAILFMIGTAVGMAVPHDPPPLVCVEQLRTNHQIPGVFAVTLMCRVDVEQEVTFEPAEPDLRSRS